MKAERKADQERRKAERKVYKEKRMAKQEADFKKMMAKWKDDQEKREAEKKADRKVATRLEAIRDKTNANQMRLEPKTQHQEKMDAWMTDMKEGQKDGTACQELTKANIEKMELNPEEKKGCSRTAGDS
jgi:hypothetical protein